MLPRRTFISASLSGVGAVWLGADRAVLRETAHHAANALAVLPPSLTAEQIRALDALTARILPTDDLPGAREANVVRFIDRALATFAANQRSLFEVGLRDLDDRARRRRPDQGTFAALSSTDQIELMHTLEAENSEFFDAALFATMAGMFADPSCGGNTDKVGWKLLGFDDRFIWQPPFGSYDA